MVGSRLGKTRLGVSKAIAQHYCFFGAGKRSIFGRPGKLHRLVLERRQYEASPEKHFEHCAHIA
jgi:hypothetical protein